MWIMWAFQLRYQEPFQTRPSSTEGRLKKFTKMVNHSSRIWPPSQTGV